MCWLISWSKSCLHLCPHLPPPAPESQETLEVSVQGSLKELFFLSCLHLCPHLPPPAPESQETLEVSVQGSLKELFFLSLRELFYFSNPHCLWNELALVLFKLFSGTSGYPRGLGQRYKHGLRCSCIRITVQISMCWPEPRHFAVFVCFSHDTLKTSAYDQETSTITHCCADQPTVP